MVRRFKKEKTEEEMSPVDAFLVATSAASKSLLEKRIVANDESAEAILSLEEELLVALDGDVLRGLPSLIQGASFYALRVGNTGRFGSMEYLPRDGRDAIVLSRLGTLVRARSRGGSAIVTPLNPDDYRADLLLPYVTAVQEALEKHLERTSARIASYESATILARKISEIVG